MIASDQVHRVRDLLGDWGIDTFQWDSAKVLEALSSAQALIAEELSNVRDDVICACTNGVITIPFETIDVLRVVSPVGILLKTTQQLEDLKNSGWRTLVGTPHAWMPESGSTLRLNRTWSGSVTVGIIEHPVDLVDEDDTVDARIPENMQDSLKYAAASFLLAQAGSTQDMEKADLLLAHFYKELGVAYKPQGRKTE